MANQDHRPPDDASINNDDVLYCRIFPGPDSLRPAEGGGSRPTGGSLRPPDKSQPKSVDLGSLCTPEDTRVRGTHGNFHVVQMRVEDVRAQGLRVVRDPLLDETPPNSAHAVILGNKEDAAKDKHGGLTDGEYSKLAAIARAILIHH